MIQNAEANDTTVYRRLGRPGVMREVNRHGRPGSDGPISVGAERVAWR